MASARDAYLDIETTGLAYTYDTLTVIGIYLHNDHDDELIQLIGEEATADALIGALEEVDTIFTYNGSRFDLPFINAYLGVDLARHCPHHDLMYDCWRNNLYGGLKSVERQLGIERRLKAIDGLGAIRLWWKYRNDDDRDALNTLLMYNSEDLKNLRTLRGILANYSRR
jgi:uncharacterized protein YprB with RNaseH-like and TPR domain